MEIVSREAAQQIVDTVKDVCSQNINFIDEKGLSEDTLCRVVIVHLNVRYNPNNLFMIQSAITQAFAQLTGYNPRKFTDAVVLYSAVRLEDIPES